MVRTLVRGTTILWMGVILTGCASRSSTSSTMMGTGTAAASTSPDGATAGAASARESVETFMTAVKAQDLQTMAAVWGNSRGPAREQFDREQLEKRLIVIQCKLDHEQWAFAADRARLISGGRQDFQVRLRQKQVEATTSFTTIQGPTGRWYVEIVDLDPLRDFCR